MSKIKPFLLRSFITIGISLILSACGGGSDSASGDTDSATSNAPSNIIGSKMVQTVVKTDGKATTISVGKTVTYEFITQSTILGAGLHTLPTTSWDYSRSGDSATVNLNYEPGKSIEKLKFTTKTTGTYRSESTLNTGTTGWVEGTFVISALPERTGITLYTRSMSTTGHISVAINGQNKGTLTGSYQDGYSPSFGDSNYGTITVYLSPGQYTLTVTPTHTPSRVLTITIGSTSKLLYEL